MTAPAPIYTPESPDDLRDGLLRGFYAHLVPPQPVPTGKTK